MVSPSATVVSPAVTATVFPVQRPQFVAPTGRSSDDDVLFEKNLRQHLGVSGENTRGDHPVSFSLPSFSGGVLSVFIETMAEKGFRGISRPLSSFAQPSFARVGEGRTTGDESGNEDVSEVDMGSSYSETMRRWGWSSDSKASGGISLSLMPIRALYRSAKAVYHQAQIAVGTYPLAKRAETLDLVA